MFTGGLCHSIGVSLFHNNGSHVKDIAYGMSQNITGGVAGRLSTKALAIRRDCDGRC